MTTYKRAFIGDGYDDEYRDDEYLFWAAFRPLVKRERALFFQAAKNASGDVVFDLESKVIAEKVLAWSWPDDPHPNSQFYERKVDIIHADGLDPILRGRLMRAILLRPQAEDMEKEQTNLGNSKAGYDSSSSTRSSQPETATPADDSSSTTSQDESEDTHELENLSLAQQE